jgi:hypothetical protein
MKADKHPARAGQDAPLNPFAGLSSEGLAPGPQKKGGGQSPAAARNRGRVDIIRQTAHRGGKTVTVITNVSHFGCVGAVASLPFCPSDGSRVLVESKGESYGNWL